MTPSTQESPGTVRAVPVPADGTRTYARLWPLQYLSGFAIAVATLAITIRADAFAGFFTGSAVLLALAHSLTFLAFTPVGVVSGRLVDRWGPRRVLVGSNVGYLVIMVVALLALAAAFFPPWLAIALLLARTGSQSAQLTALESSVPRLFSRRDLIRANGPRMIFTASVAGFEGPIAAVLFPVAGLLALIGATVVVLVVSLVGAVRAGIPDNPVPPPGAEPADRTYRPLAAHVRRRPGLVIVIGAFALFNFVLGFCELSDRQVTASLGSEATTSAVLGVGFLFMIATTVGITLRGTPRGHARWLRICFLATGGAMVLGSLRPNIFLVTVAVVVFLVSATLIMAIVSTLLHANTEPSIMGRMMGVKTTTIGLFYGSGCVAAALFSNTPEALAGGERVSGGLLGAVVGSGEAYGRVYAFLTLVLGVVVLALTLGVGRHRTLRALDDPSVAESTLPRRPAADEWLEARGTTTAGTAPRDAGPVERNADRAEELAANRPGAG